MVTLDQINHHIVTCERCPRLVEFRQEVAKTKRRMYLDWEYWGKPVPGFGDQYARLLVVGLAPAAHGANRTGRMFTGDRSADWLINALYKQDWCNLPVSSSRNDGLVLKDTYISSVLHCAPPANKPTQAELINCRSYLGTDMVLLKNLRVIVGLGQIAFNGILAAWAEIGLSLPKPRPKFKHGATYSLNPSITLVASYHPSQQNTQTGRLTRSMLDGLFKSVRILLDS